MARYSYQTVTRGGKTYRRRLPTKATKLAGIEKFRAKMALRKAQRNGEAATVPAAPTKEATKARPNGHATVQANDDEAQAAARLGARLEAALVHLRRGTEWLDRSGMSLRSFDPAHLELLNAHAELARK